MWIGINPAFIAPIPNMKLRPLLDKFESLAALLQSPLLLLIRLYWGWSFAQTGWGKLMNLDRTANFFADLNIPLPKLNALMAGGTECLGGLLLLVGLFSRLSSAALAGVMLVAYATADREALMGIFNDTEKFTSAAPFLFLFAVLVVLAFGPGKFSLDHFWLKKTSESSS